jgi:hypothetical protein
LEDEDDNEDQDDKPNASITQQLSKKKNVQVSAGKKKRDDALKSEVCLPFQIYLL